MRESKKVEYINKISNYHSKWLVFRWFDSFAPPENHILKWLILLFSIMSGLTTADTGIPQGEIPIGESKSYPNFNYFR